MDIQNINTQITNNIKLLRETRDALKIRANDKAKALGEYEKAIALTMLRLRNGQKVELDGEEVVYSSATGLEKIAKGVCYKESIARDIADSKYKNAVLALQAIHTTINALQSMLRYVDET